MRIAKADIVPPTANLRDAYDSFNDLEGACQEAMDRFNAREHRETRRVPADSARWVCDILLRNASAGRRCIPLGYQMQRSGM